MSTATSGYNTSDVMCINSPYDSSTIMGIGSSFENRRSSNSSLPGADPTSFLSQNYRKFDELRRLLDNNKDTLKLEAMRRIIEMVARGQNCSDLFAAVVKNVVSKNTEVRKLVYVYLERYAEEQQDLALLSVSTFQKALRDPNQLIRSCALRVLSSIRVPMITPIVMLAIKDCAQDMSPFVRKTVAHSIPKLHSLDPTQKEQLIDVIEKLMKDQFTMVIGSAIVAFEQVCPDHIIFIHQNYRKLCSVLPDIDEWGQVYVLNMLTRYARTQFLNPDSSKKLIRDPTFFSSTDSCSDNEASIDNKTEESQLYVIDPDHRLLLRSSKSLLQSRNSSVVLAVVQLYYHLAPKNELSIVARPMTRLLKSHREIRTVVLANIATISANNSGIFESFLKQFFITTDEPTHVKKIKLEILINIANEVNAPTILREFGVYIFDDDFQFVSASIHAIGRIASNISQLSDVCLSGLLGLLSCPDPNIAGESVVVIQRLLQLGPALNKDVIIRLSSMLDKTENSRARASILWMIGEHCDKVPKIAPDVLRKAANSFSSETDHVKLQSLNLALKLYFTNSKQTRLLCQYVLSLGRYDLSYDIRDKARFFRNLICPQGDYILQKYAKKLIISPKPAPMSRSPYKDREQWQLGTLSHFLNFKVIGYKPLPEFPHVAPDPSVRDTTGDYSNNGISGKQLQKSISKNYFYSSESDSGSDSYSDTEVDTGKSSESSSITPSSASSLSSSTSLDNIDQSVSGRDIETSSISDISDLVEPLKNLPSHLDDQFTHSHLVNKQNANENYAVDNIQKSLIDQNILVPTGNTAVNLEPITPIFVDARYIEILNEYMGNGISIQYRMLRRRLLFSPNMIEVELLIENHHFTNSYSDLVVNNPDAEYIIDIISGIGEIEPLGKVCFSIGLDFKDSIQPVKLFINSIEHQLNLTIYISPNCGELVLPIHLSEELFFSFLKKVGGMNTGVIQIHLKETIETIHSKVIETCNLNSIKSLDQQYLLYAGITASNNSLVLVSISIQSLECISLQVNCEHLVISEILFGYIQKILETKLV